MTTTTTTTMTTTDDLTVWLLDAYHTSDRRYVRDDLEQLLAAGDELEAAWLEVEGARPEVTLLGRAPTPDEDDELTLGAWVITELGGDPTTCDPDEVQVAQRAIQRLLDVGDALTSVHVALHMRTERDKTALPGQRIPVAPHYAWLHAEEGWLDDPIIWFQDAGLLPDHDDDADH